MLSDYEVLSLLIQLATFIVIYVNANNENNQPPNAR